MAASGGRNVKAKSSFLPSIVQACLAPALRPLRTAAESEPGDGDYYNESDSESSVILNQTGSQAAVHVSQGAAVILTVRHIQGTAASQWGAVPAAIK
ncbi:hypothetical protein BaRGS_00009526 [Batillaria attramentaria]|uniref:Uncharacterized protein n=1 Tax=Batillaria attramentaria TaxID=370345 RepID=A0ABD0LJ09_9CAEN